MIHNPRQEILEILGRIAAAKEPVRLINDHRGIPVAYDATIEGFQESAVVFRVHKYQCVCLELERFTHIQSSSLPSIVKGRLMSLDVVETLATLANFEYASDTIGRRTTVRVQPKDPVDVWITYGGEKFRGNLADISSNGIGVFLVSAYLKSPGLLKKNESVLMIIRLPGERGSGMEVRLPGKILYINRDRGSFRLGVSTNPESHGKTTIGQFVAQRQAEIMRELRILYDTFYRIKQENQAK